MRKAVLVLTTMTSADDAVALARTLIEEGLAACVNVGAVMRSIYRWNGTVEDVEERQIVIKTTADRLAALEQRVAALHPYDVPEWLVLPTDGGSQAYLAWLNAGTTGADT